MTTLPNSIAREPASRFRGLRPALGMTWIARAAIVLGFLALLGAWLATWRGGPVLGLSEEHLFRDATVLMLLGIAFLVDALVHERIG